ncbi:MAG: TylF/MycF/NovP-related O-methyltransferase [Candidatus Sulfotelmatobacter sp.]
MTVARDFATRLNELLRRGLHEMVRTVARPFLAPARYLNQPLAMWPPIFGAVHEVRLPRRTEPHPFPRPTGAANIKILLAMIDRTISIEGDVAECGVFRGATLVPMAVHLKQRCCSKRLLGFDSFEGYDDSILLDISMDAPDEPCKRVRGFRDTSRSIVLGKLLRFRSDNVTLVPGYFHDSLPRCEDRRFSFVHLDLGIYQAYKECLEFFYPRMSSGGIILANDYNKPPWPGCKKAVDEFLTGKPEKLQLFEMDNYQRFYICKL